MGSRNILNYAAHRSTRQGRAILLLLQEFRMTDRASKVKVQYYFASGSEAYIHIQHRHFDYEGGARSFQFAGDADGDVEPVVGQIWSNLVKNQFVFSLDGSKNAMAGRWQRALKKSPDEYKAVAWDVVYM